MTFYRCTVLVVASLISCKSVLGQTPNEIMALAAKASAEAPITTVSLEFDAVISDPPLSEKRLGTLIARQAEVHKFGMENYKNQPEIRKQFEKSLAENDVTVRRQAEEYRIRQVEGHYYRFGPELGGDVMYEGKVKKGKDPPFDLILLQRKLDETNYRSVFHDISSRMVVIS